MTPAGCRRHENGATVALIVHICACFNKNVEDLHAPAGHCRIPERCFASHAGVGAGALLQQILDDVDLSVLSLPEEQDVIKALLDFPALVAGAAEALEPHRVATYLHDTAAQLYK